MANDVFSVNQENPFHAKRIELLGAIERELNRMYKKKFSVISYVFNTSDPTVNFPMQNSHIIYIEDLIRLSKSDDNDILCLIIDSYGGDANFPTELVNRIHAYYEEFYVIGINMLKSAATLLSILSNKIIAVSTASFGPIDPQIMYSTSEGIPIAISARAVIDLFEHLLPEYVKDKTAAERTVILSTQNYHLYQQAKDAVNLIDIVLNSMNFPKAHLQEVRAKLITTPPSHGLRISVDDLIDLGFPVEKIQVSDTLASLLFEYHRRALRNLIMESPVAPQGMINRGLVLFESTKRSLQITATLPYLPVALPISRPAVPVSKPSEGSHPFPSAPDKK